MLSFGANLTNQMASHHDKGLIIASTVEVYTNTPTTTIPADSTSLHREDPRIAPEWAVLPLWR